MVSRIFSAGAVVGHAVWATPESRYAARRQGFRYRWFARSPLTRFAPPRAMNEVPSTHVMKSEARVAARVPDHRRVCGTF
jgi:hypothetical protein